MKNTISARILLFALVAFFTMFCIGCSARSGGSVSFDGGSLEVSNKTLTVQLQGNPTTGYQWSSDIRGSGITSVSSDYKHDAKGGNLTGAGGTYIFRFDGVAEGASEIAFTYARPWETNEQDEVILVDVRTVSSGIISSVEVKKGQENLGSVEVG